MNPQFSVIFLTTLIGAGQGLFVALFTAELGALFELLPAPRRPWFFFYGSLIAFALTGAGLVASFFHLGRPERAWRSAARWRTSWLSREVIVLPAFMGTVLLVRASRISSTSPRTLATLPSGAAIDATIVLGVAGTVLAFALFLCTAMIYACVRFLREWATPLTVVNYTLLGCASGFALAAAFSTAMAPPLRRLLHRPARWSSRCSASSVAPPRWCATRGCARRRRCRRRSASSIRGSSRSRRVSWAARSTPASSSTAARRRLLRSVRWLFLVGAFALPLLLFAAGLAGAPAITIVAAFAIQYAGLLAERWFFFAQANHPQNLYYQAIG